jgi:hypothetical protein
MKLRIVSSGLLALVLRFRHSGGRNHGPTATFNAIIHIAARALGTLRRPDREQTLSAGTDSRYDEDVSTPDIAAFRDYALAAAPAAGAVGNYCDHAEHNEAVEAVWVLDAADALRELALSLARARELDLLELYARRLGAIESANVLQRDGGFDGAAAARAAGTWRELQLVQAEHDRNYHPDVIGLSRAEQLRHYAFRLAKIVGAFAAASDEQELLERRLPDTLIFAIKLRTVMAKRLPDEPLPRR